ncbi:MAG: CDP-diacylglycerol--serine O-phosphatidyltransferase, partial [Pseudomonadota bacterium]
MFKDEPEDHSSEQRKSSSNITSSIMLEVVESDTQDGKKVRSRGIFLLPNALTTAALFAGFYAILSAAQGSFNQAAVAIFVAMIMD